MGFHPNSQISDEREAEGLAPDRITASPMTPLFELPSPPDCLARLQWVTSALSRSSTPEEMANVVVSHAFDSLGASVGIAYFASSEGVRYASSRGAVDSDAEKWRSGLLDPPALMSVIRTGEALWLACREDLLRRCPHLADAATPPERLQALAALPLRI